MTLYFGADVLHRATDKEEQAMKKALVTGLAVVLGIGLIGYALADPDHGRGTRDGLRTGLDAERWRLRSRLDAPRFRL